MRNIAVLRKIVGKAIPVLGAAALAELGISAYFYRRTMTRNNAKTERTIKMAGTDWNQHMEFIGKRKEYMLAQPHEDWWSVSEDGLKLHATWFPQGNQDKIVICFHGYTSEGMKDYIGLSGYYLKKGYSMLLVDERAHGKSEGTYIGFGCLDRKDAYEWIQMVIQECGEEAEILLHGTSMGVPNCEAKVVEEELWVRGSSVMQGYYKMPEETAETLVDGWLRTGDLGYVDEDGFVYLTGRKKNLIITKNGENVSPEELENKIGEHRMICEILVRESEGVIEAEIFPDMEYVQKKEITDVQGELQKLIDEYNIAAPAYKRVYRLKVRDTEFAKTPSKKIKRY